MANRMTAGMPLCELYLAAGKACYGMHWTSDEAARSHHQGQQPKRWWLVELQVQLCAVPSSMVLLRPA
jgi:hypothetical protein